MEVVASPRPRAIHVVEIEVAVDWASQGLLPHAPEWLCRTRACRCMSLNLRAYVESLPPRSLDLILIDVDNGPDFLVHESNASLYQSPFSNDRVWRFSQVACLRFGRRPDQPGYGMH